MSLLPLLQGFALGAAICASLGPQSAFVLRQGIRGEAALAVAAICTVADLTLIAAAVGGADALVRRLPETAAVGVWGAALFVLIYGCLAIGAGLRPATAALPAPTGGGRSAALTAAAALSLLNPQVYLEMVVLVGGMALLFPPAERAVFALGVAVVSPLWFFGLAVGGRRLAGLFARPRALRTLDLGTGLVMVMLAVTMVLGELGWL